MSEQAEQAPQRWSTGRIDAFSDGVFAIAITLLILEVKIAPADLDHVWKALVDEWPSYLAYVTSFFTVGGVWLAHHGLFTRLRYVDPVLMRLNILLLMVVAFLPFPTGLMAEALTGSRGAERAAVIVYGVTALVIELLMQTMTRYAAAHPELMHGGAAPTPAAGPLERSLTRGTLRTVGYGLAIIVGVALLPKAAAFSYFLVAAVAVLSPGGEGRLTHLGTRG